MIDWRESLQYYFEWVSWEDYYTTQDLCYWYQNKCRVYEDEL